VSSNTVLSVNQTAGAGITVSSPTGNVVVTANISRVQVQSSTLGIGIGTNTLSYASLTTSSQILQIDIPNNLSIGNITLTGNLSSNNITVSNSLNALGNITANYFYGNGNNISNIDGLNIIGADGNSSNVLYGNGVFAAAPSSGLTTFTRSATWQSSSGAVTVPVVDVPIYMHSACTLIEATILTLGGTGSCVVDIWKTPIGTYPPTSGKSICGGNYPTITSGVTLVDTSLSGWTTAVSAGDTIMFHLTSSSTFTYITIQLTFST
jgi:hypothetical protein